MTERTNRFELTAQRGFNCAPGAIHLYVSDFDFAKNEILVAEPLKLKTGHEAYTPLTPFLTIEKGHGQKLMDDLWDCGLRPSEGTGSAGAMSATQHHLKDLQRIVFKGYK